MSWGGAAQFIGIAIVMLPLAGIPFAIWLYLDYRKYQRRTEIEARLHRWVAP